MLCAQTGMSAFERGKQACNGSIVFAGGNQAANVVSLIQRDTLCKAISAPSCLFS